MAESARLMSRNGMDPEPDSVSTMRNGARKALSLVRDRLAALIARPEPGICEELLRGDMLRLLVLSLVAMPVHLVFATVFILAPKDGSPTDGMWHGGIVALHAGMFVLMVVAFAVTLRARRRRCGLPAMQGFLSLFLFVFILAGAAIALVDQLATTNITPYLLVCSIVAMGFRLSPLRALLLFSGAYIAFFIALPSVQADPNIVLTNRINAFTFVLLGTGLASVLRSAEVRVIGQRKTIEFQRKELEEKNARLEFLAAHDPLTELYNRREFDRLLEKEISRIRRYGGAVCIVMIDLDDFKMVNDTYGHHAGDAALVRTAGLLSANLRGSDILARWGGEEFIVLLPDADIDRGIAVAEKLRAVLDGQPLEIRGSSIRLTASFGVAATDESGAGDFELLYQAADCALYKAKHAGKNRVDAC